jgi:hypothetical protein
MIIDVDKPFPEEWKDKKSISVEEYREFLSVKPKQSKYKARKVMVDGILFDSQKEANRYCELSWMKNNGILEDFELQPVFILQEKFKKDGVTHRQIKYIADFKVIYPDGRVEVEDVKGYQTTDFKIKRKMFEVKFPELTLKLL